MAEDPQNESDFTAEDNASLVKATESLGSRRITAYIIDFWLILAGPLFLTRLLNENFLYTLVPFDRMIGLT